VASFLIGHSIYVSPGEAKVYKALPPPHPLSSYFCLSDFSVQPVVPV